MRYGRLLAWSTALVFFIVPLALATDFTGMYRSPEVTLKLTPAAEAYTGTLVIKDVSYPVTARENAGALEGSFTVQNTKFDFTAKLSGEKLALQSGGKSYALQRDPKPPAAVPANPLDQVAPADGQAHPATAQPAQPQPQPITPAVVPQANAADGQTGPTGDAALAALKDLGAVKTDPNRDWLMLVYLNGDNSLADEAAFNIKQMETGFPESGMDVIVLWDCPIEKMKDGHMNHPKLGRIRKSRHTEPNILDSEVLKDFGALDMADPKLLAAFIEGAVKAYPATHHVLFTWDHGGGWASLNNDDYAPGKPNHRDDMNLPKLREGMIAGMKAAGLKKWDIMVFDMCLMAQIEVAAQIHDLADVMVASEELVPGKGMPYTHVMEAFGKGTLGGRGVAKNIVLEFDKFHKEDKQRSTTLSALDLTYFDEVNAKLNAVCDKLIPAMPKGWSGLARSYFYAEQYNSSHEDFRRGKNARQSIDLLDTLKKCRSGMPGFPAEAEYAAFVQAMDRFVIVSANSQRRRMSNGVAVYAPVIKEAYNPDYEQTEFAKVSHWPRLLQSLYPEQAKNNEPPKFTKIELVDSQDKPVTALRPLTGYGTAIEVEGKNLVWVRHMMAVHDADVGGARVLTKDYIVDSHYMEKIMKGAEHFGQDTDIFMPQLTDGVNKLREPQYGLIFLMSNGENTVQVLIDNSELSEPTKFTVPVLVEDPKLGDKPVGGLLHSNGVDLSVRGIEVTIQSPDGHEVAQLFEPSPDTKFTPLFEVFKDDGSRKWVPKGSITWKKGLSFTMDLQPAGDYEEIMVAETMSGASTTARFKYKAETDEKLVNAKQTWKPFKSEMMVGTWEWSVMTDPPKPINVSMTIEPTKNPFTYLMTLDSPADGGKRQVQHGLLILEIHDQPFFRLITIPDNGPSGAILGTMWWDPKDGVSRIMTRQLALDMNILWEKKGGGPTPPVVKPEGWTTITDANQSISLAVPPGFVVDKTAVQRGKSVFKGYESYVVDGDLVAAVEMIRFDGINDPDVALKALMVGARQLGTRLELGAPQKGPIGGVEAVSYGGLAANSGLVLNVGVNFIPTAKGIVAVNFACSPQTAQMVLPTLTKIGGTIQVTAPAQPK